MLRRTLPAVLLALGLAPGAQAQQNDPSFRIVNNTRHVVNEIYASSSNERNWGQDRLGRDVVNPGANYIVRLQPGDCTYDVRVVYQGGLAEERRRINTCNITDLQLPLVANAPVQQGDQPQRQPQQGPQAQPQPGPQAQPQPGPQGQQGPRTGNPSFNLVNQSGRVIEEFYASPGSARDWGQDRLGNDTVQPGQSYAVRLPEGECVYDLRAVFQGGGQPQERRGVNLCVLDNYVVR
jgi:hypothetical protein